MTINITVTLSDLITVSHESSQARFFMSKEPEIQKSKLLFHSEHLT